MNRPTLFIMLFVASSRLGSAAQEWIPLFDGKTLNGLEAQREQNHLESRGRHGRSRKTRLLHLNDRGMPLDREQPVAAISEITQILTELTHRHGSHDWPSSMRTRWESSRTEKGRRNAIPFPACATNS